MPQVGARPIDHLELRVAAANQAHRTARSLARVDDVTIEIEHTLHDGHHHLAIGRNGATCTFAPIVPPPHAFDLDIRITD